MVTLHTMNQKRSARSVLVEKILPLVIRMQDPDQPAVYEAAFKRSQADYELPATVAKSKQIAFEPAIDEQTVVIRPEKGPVERTVYFLHGGAYWAQPTIYHYRTWQKMADANQAQIIVPIYPKAPAHQAPAVMDYVWQNFQKVCQFTKLPVQELILMGDSAGGGLALTLLQLLLRAGYEKAALPQQIVLFSPWLDLTDQNPKKATLQSVDRLLQLGPLTKEGALYAGPLSVKDPLVSPLFADWSRFPDVKILTGTHDLLYADVLALQAQETAPAEIYCYPEMDHDFVLFPIPEAAQALTQVSSWLMAE
ncbi:alpha/beta hydrolase [Leuconostocaceae bacterium ESL0958]|nr:alpha/beta hydrolase [Leuconostocaceae bacterium ESL0958]